MPRATGSATGGLSDRRAQRAGSATGGGRVATAEQVFDLGAHGLEFGAAAVGGCSVLGKVDG